MSGFSSRGMLTASATLDFGNTLAQTSTDLTLNVPGAATGDCAQVCPPAAAVLANSIYTAWVSAADTVTVRFSNFGLIARDPGSGTFNVKVVKQ